MRCKACHKRLAKSEIVYVEKLQEHEYLCQNCLGVAMEAAYEDYIIDEEGELIKINPEDCQSLHAATLEYLKNKENDE